jgi:hypothetical protein
MADQTGGLIDHQQVVAFVNGFEQVQQDSL